MKVKGSRGVKAMSQKAAVAENGRSWWGERDRRGDGEQLSSLPA